MDFQLLTPAPPAAPPKREVALLAEQIAALAQFGALARGHAQLKNRQPDENPAIGIRAVEGSRLHLVCFYTALPVPDYEPAPGDPPRYEPIERIVGPDGEILYDDLEGYLERAGEST